MGLGELIDFRVLFEFWRALSENWRWGVKVVRTADPRNFSISLCQ